MPALMIEYCPRTSASPGCRSAGSIVISSSSARSRAVKTTPRPRIARSFRLRYSPSPGPSRCPCRSRSCRLSTGRDSLLGAEVREIVHRTAHFPVQFGSRGPVPRRTSRHVFEFEREDAVVADILEGMKKRCPVHFAFSGPPMRVALPVVVAAMRMMHVRSERIYRVVRNIAAGEKMAGIEVQAEIVRPVRSMSRSMPCAEETQR